MSENKMSEIIRSSLDSIKGFTDVNTVFGNAVTTPGGVTVIPVSKITVGFAGGGVDFGQRKLQPSQNFGGGSGTGISVTPIAFLTISPDCKIDLINVTAPVSGAVEKALELVESSPEIIKRIKDTITG